MKSEIEKYFHVPSCRSQERNSFISKVMFFFFFRCEYAAYCASVHIHLPWVVNVSVINKILFSFMRYRSARAHMKIPFTEYQIHARARSLTRSFVRSSLMWPSELCRITCSINNTTMHEVWRYQQCEIFLFFLFSIFIFFSSLIVTLRALVCFVLTMSFIFKGK